MIKVELINKEEIKKLYKTWGTFARQCYNTPKGKEEVVGRHCHKSAHYSGSRTTSFIFEISGISRACIAQINRHCIGVTINERSMRYVDFSNAKIKIPHTIEKNEKAKEIFENAVETCVNAYRDIQVELEKDGIKGELANQDCRYILPLGTETCGTYGFTLEALMHFMNKRLCTRSQWEIREVAKLMKEEVLKALPELEEYLVPECENLLWCPEGKSSCGKAPTKKEFKEILKKAKEGK